MTFPELRSPRELDIVRRLARARSVPNVSRREWSSMLHPLTPQEHSVHFHASSKNQLGRSCRVRDSLLMKCAAQPMRSSLQKLYSHRSAAPVPTTQETTTHGLRRANR